MKKLIMAVAVVCAAAMSQAAAVDWGASAASTYNGQTMYLVTAMADTYTSAQEFIATAIDSATVAKNGKKYTITAHTASSDSITGSGNLYLAVINGDKINYVDVSSGMNAVVYTPPSQSPGNFSVSFADVSGSSTYATIQGVPEPTSGLLLLLGFAGLALRRRRA